VLQQQRRLQSEKRTDYDAASDPGLIKLNQGYGNLTLGAMTSTDMFDFLVLAAAFPSRALH
jgi:hypothetical protein